VVVVVEIGAMLMMVTKMTNSEPPPAPMSCI
jgi:hypothetical protein